MRIFVTGGGGFVGRRVVRRLCAAGHEVIAPLRSAANGLDVGSVDDLASAVADATPNVIVNLAARVDYNATMKDLFAPNVLCPAVLADYCARQGVYLVHASTIGVHGSSARLIDTTCAEAPDTAYAATKLLAEKAIAASICPAAVIRFPGIFGADGPEHLGVNRAISLARAGVVPTLVGRGSGRRNYIFVEDAARVIGTVVGRRLEGLYYAAGGVRTIAGMLEDVCDRWLPGQRPVAVAGDDSADQVVTPSPELGAVRTFDEALAAIP